MIYIFHIFNFSFSLFFFSSIFLPAVIVTEKQEEDFWTKGKGHLTEGKEGSV